MDNDTLSSSYPTSDGSQASSSQNAGSAGYSSQSSGSTYNSGTEAPDLMRRVVQGAHQTIDQLADKAAPHVQRLQQGVEGAGSVLQERKEQLRTVSDEWSDSLRTTVRENPLTAVATAMLVGMIVARLNR